MTEFENFDSKPEEGLNLSEFDLFFFLKFSFKLAELNNFLAFRQHLHLVLTVYLPSKLIP